MPILAWACSIISTYKKRHIAKSFARNSRKQMLLIKICGWSNSEICTLTGTKVFSTNCGHLRKHIVNQFPLRIYGLWQIQQGFSLMHIDLYDAKYLDHLSYNLNSWFVKARMLCRTSNSTLCLWQVRWHSLLFLAMNLHCTYTDTCSDCLHLTQACWCCQGAGAPQDRHIFGRWRTGTPTVSH